MCLLLLLWSPFFLVCRFFCLFTLFCCTLGCTYYQYTFNSTAPTRTAWLLLYLWAPTYERCCCRTSYDLQHSPSWLLLLLLIVDELVYHALLLLCHIYPTQPMRFIKKKRITSAVRTTDWMVETQLCKLRCISDKLVGRAYFIKSLYKKLKNVSCEYDRVNGWNSTLQAA